VRRSESASRASVRHTEASSTRLRASVDVTDARCAKLKGVVRVQLIARQSGPKCQPAKPGRNRGGAVGGNCSPRTRRPRSRFPKNLRRRRCAVAGNGLGTRGTRCRDLSGPPLDHSSLATTAASDQARNPGARRIPDGKNRQPANCLTGAKLQKRRLHTVRLRWTPKIGPLGMLN